MTSEIVIGLLSLVGTALGSITGVMAANKLSNYRISQLEEKVSKHNNLIERMTVVEQSIKSVHQRLDDLKEEIKSEL
nr:MAG TPA: Hemolysin [Bacteriophage sp.]